MAIGAGGGSVRLAPQAILVAGMLGFCKRADL